MINIVNTNNILSRGGDSILNQVILVGRLTRDITVNKSKKAKVATVSLAVPRSFKNVDGNYDTDFIDCLAFDTVAENVAEYCKKGDVVGVKGRIQSRKIEEDGINKNVMEIISEKITFLSSKKSNEEADE